MFTSDLSVCLIPDVDPSFNLDPVLISGEAEQEYTSNYSCAGCSQYLLSLS